jgi:hypothetical protein
MVDRPNQECIDSSYIDAVGAGKLGSAKEPTVIMQSSGARSLSVKTLLPQFGQKCQRGENPLSPLRAYILWSPSTRIWDLASVSRNAPQSRYGVGTIDNGTDRPALARPMLSLLKRRNGTAQFAPIPFSRFHANLFCPSTRTLSSVHRQGFKC